MHKLNKYEIEELEDGKLLVKDESTKDKIIEFPDGEYLVINGAWYLESLPNQVVIEKADGLLAKFRLTPFRKITENEFTTYAAYHPRKCKGQPLPDYLYKFYGLKRNDETLSEVVRVRLSPSEKEKLDIYCKNNETTASELIRNFIAGL